MSRPLFREEAINAQRVKTQGRVILIKPPALWLVTLLVLGIGILVALYFWLGTYTRRITVTGQLTPTSGVVRVITPQTGVIERVLVTTGQPVKAGQHLFTLNSDRQLAGGAIGAVIAQQVQERQASLRHEMERTHQIQGQESSSQQRRIDSLVKDSSDARQAIAEQQHRIGLNQETANRYRALFNQGFVSKDQLREREEALSDQQARLKAQQRELGGVERDLALAQREQQAMPSRHATQIEQLDRQLSQTNQELTQTQGQRLTNVVATVDGLVSSVLGHSGDMADSTKPLALLTPKDAQLKAELIVPSEAIGFVKPGQNVLIRYAAYPYQKFGQARGTVTNVSRLALTPEELVASGSNVPVEALQTRIPMYRIDVALHRQSILAYGEEHALQSGMTLSADLLQEKRHLYEWILEPLYAMQSRMEDGSTQKAVGGP